MEHIVSNFWIRGNYSDQDNNDQPDTMFQRISHLTDYTSSTIAYNSVYVGKK